MFIYQIENKINGKKYIGSTNSPERRKKEHFGSARWQSCQSFTYPLQRAIRKYGEENFIFSILEECDKEIVAERERYYIELYNTLANTGHGYNQTLYTECALRDEEIKRQYVLKQGKKCALVDENNNIIKVFESYHAAAREVLNINEASPIRKVCKGELRSTAGFIFRDIDENGNIIIPERTPREYKTSICGINVFDKKDIVYYGSILEAATQEKVERSSIQKCIGGQKKYRQVGFRIWRRIEDDQIVNNEIDIDDIIKDYQKKYIFYNNQWQLVSAVARQRGLKPPTVAARIRNGKTVEEALEL